MTRLEVIRERVEMARLTADALEMEIGGQYPELEYLLGIVDAAFEMVGTFDENAATIRYNNHERRQDWEQRAKIFGTAARQLNLKLDEAVEKL